MLRGLKHTLESFLRETRFCFLINVEQKAHLYITVFVVENYLLNHLLKVVFIITNYSVHKITAFNTSLSQTFQYFTASLFHSGRRRIASKQTSKQCSQHGYGSTFSHLE